MKCDNIALCTVLLIVFIVGLFIGMLTQADRSDRNHKEAVCKVLNINNSTNEYFSCISLPSFATVIKEIR